MKSLKIEKGALAQKVNVPSSKSYANRVLILAALKDAPFKITNISDCTDVLMLIDALKKVGVKVTCTDGVVTVHNSFPACEQKGQTIKVGEGGTTARFLASLLLKGKEPYELILGERLKARPWEEFINFVNQHGGKAELTDSSLKIQGPVNLPSKISLDCSRTTQFASGIQLTYPTTNVEPVSMTSSQSYWAMTSSLIDTVSKTDTYTIPLDWSSASYPMTYAALNHSIEFPGMKIDSLQADSKLFSVLEKMDAITETADGFIVRPSTKDQPVDMDVSDCLDLVPALAYLLAHKPGIHRLHGIKNLNLKESKRLDEIIRVLDLFFRVSTVSGDTLTINGHKDLVKEEVHLFLPNDHRMVMMATLFLRHHSGGSLVPSEAVKKSYPDFFELIKTK